MVSRFSTFPLYRMTRGCRVVSRFSTFPLYRMASGCRVVSPFSTFPLYRIASRCRVVLPFSPITLYKIRSRPLAGSLKMPPKAANLKENCAANDGFSGSACLTLAGARNYQQPGLGNEKKPWLCSIASPSQGLKKVNRPWLMHEIISSQGSQTKIVPGYDTLLRSARAGKEKTTLADVHYFPQPGSRTVCMLNCAANDDASGAPPKAAPPTPLPAAHIS